jgi:transketolase
MRRAFSQALFELATHEGRLAFITADLGFQVFDDFEKRFPSRYVNVGVAEAQGIYVAAGMAAEGWLPITYSIASFATGRPLEQIRFCVSYPALPVTLVGAGRGYTYSTSGVSHHAVDDIALMSALPNMRVVIPGDPGEIAQLLPQVVASRGPSYFTVGRFGEPRFDAEEQAILDKARLLRGGKTPVAIFTTGEMANEVLAAHRLLTAQGIEPRIYQLHTVKPLDTATLEWVATEVAAMVIVEEHLPNGGLWSAIASWHAAANSTVKMKRLGPPDRYALGTVEHGELRRRLGYDAQSIADTCRTLCQTCT